MAKTLNIGLPVMLQSEPEIQAFLKAKERIESYWQSAGQSLNIGAFLFYLPFALKDENREKQIINQRKYQVPILHAQASFQLKHNLVYNKNKDISANGKDLLDNVVEQVAELRKYDSSNFPVDVDFNVGAYLCRHIPEQRSVSFVYSLDEFLQQKEEIFQRSVSRFSELEALAQKKDLKVALENASTALFVSLPHLKGEPPRMYIHPFNDLNSMNKISGRRIVLDVAHWAATRSAPELFEKNKAYDDKALLFEIEGINSWDEYMERHPCIDSYLPYTKLFHISNSTGLGAYLEGDLKEKWGEIGTIEGIIPKEDFRNILSHAIKYEKPVIIEVNYDVKNISVNQFKEADEFLRYILEE